jgi:ankyrin repeat protein
MFDPCSNIAAKERNGKTALHAACERGHEKIVRWLLERGANVKCYDSRRRTPVVVCFENNHVPLAKIVSTS